MDAVALLQVSDLCKSFDSRTALAELTLTVGPGEIVGLVGPNGAGKSTAFRVICGLLRADGGAVTLDGFDVRRDAQEFCARIGVLIDSPGYYPGLSARDHLVYLASVRGCESPDIVDRTLEEVGLAPRSNKRVGRFSLGMKQRLAIAMAILHSPRLLVLDEPMNGLDPVGMASLRNFLREIARRRGVGVLVSSHLLHEVEQICDRVLFIRDGRLLDEPALLHDACEIDTVVLRTGDDGRARELLSGEAFVREVSEAAVGLECRMPAADVPRLAKLLVGAGVPILELTPRRRSLEDRYIERYANSPTPGGIA